MNEAYLILRVTTYFTVLILGLMRFTQNNSKVGLYLSFLVITEFVIEYLDEIRFSSNLELLAIGDLAFIALFFLIFSEYKVPPIVLITSYTSVFVFTLISFLKNNFLHHNLSESLLSNYQLLDAIESDNLTILKAVLTVPVAFIAIWKLAIMDHPISTQRSIILTCAYIIYFSARIFLVSIGRILEYGSVEHYRIAIVILPTTFILTYGMIIASLSWKHK